MCAKSFLTRGLVLAALVGAGSPLIAEVLVPSSGGLKRPDISRRLVVFQPKVQPAIRVGVEKNVASHAVAKADVLAAISNTAKRHANSPVLSLVGLSIEEWSALFRANIEIESGYNPSAKSHVGAFGLGQLMPDTAKALGVNMYDMHQNLDGSARYLLSMLGKFERIDFALAAYNAGPGAVEKYNGVPPYTETRGHVEKVTRVYNRIKG